MKPNLSLLLLFSPSATSSFAAVNVARSAKCDVSKAYSILESLSTGTAFCSSYIHQTGVSTKSKSTTVTVNGECSTSTKTKTEHATFTTTIYGKTSTLPTLTITEYSSTVLVPSGTNPAANKRSVASVTPAKQPTTSLALTDCASETISCACSSIATPKTITITLTSTKTKKCTDTTTLTTTTTDHTATSKIPFLVSPAPIIVTSPGVLTTTVPAACASTPYYPNGNGVGNNIVPVAYPYFPQTAVECCVICYSQENCIASAVIYADDADTLLAECDLLIHVNGTQPGATSLCPLGIQNYGFGSPQPSGNTYPGPCGT